MNIELKNVIPVPLAGISFNEQSVWGNDVSFSSEQYYLVNAPSGRGKSTLVSTLFGTRTDYSGNVLFDGVDTKNISLKEWSNLRRASLAIIFQDLRLFPDLTAFENIAIKTRLSGVTFKEETIDRAAKLGIASRMNIQCKFLSLGEQQRVAIIRGISQPFRFLFMDEPFSHLDPANIELASKMILEACQKNNAGLLLTSLGEKYFFNYHKVLTS